MDGRLLFVVYVSVVTRASAATSQADQRSPCGCAIGVSPAPPSPEHVVPGGKAGGRGCSMRCKVDSPEPSPSVSCSTAAVWRPVTAASSASSNASSARTPEDHTMHARRRLSARHARGGGE
jgi:hypothetical protein